MYKFFGLLVVAIVGVYLFLGMQRPQKESAPEKYRLFLFQNGNEEQVILSNGSTWKYVAGPRPSSGEIFMRLDGRNNTDKVLMQIYWDSGMGRIVNDKMAVLELIEKPKQRWTITKIDTGSNPYLILGNGSKWLLIGKASELSGWNVGDTVMLSRDFSSPYYGNYHTMILMKDEGWKESKVLYIDSI